MVCSLPCEHILELKKQFLCGFDLKLFNFDGFSKHLSDLDPDDREVHLEFVLGVTVNNPLIEERPLKISYRRHFLKILLELAEALTCDYSPLYELYTDVIQQKEEASFHYRHYSFSDVVVTVEESTSIISDGTTGLSTWPGGLALAEWCLDNVPLFENQTVLELGCGVGLTGLVVCISQCKPYRYCFTDSHPFVLKSVERNIALNSLRDHADAIITVDKLDWNACDEFQKDFQPTLILGADIVYDRETFPSLCKTLNMFLRTKDEKAFIGCTLRNKETFNEFIKELGLNELVIVSETKIIPKRFNFPLEPPVILLSIRSKF